MAFFYPRAQTYITFWNNKKIKAQTRTQHSRASGTPSKILRMSCELLNFLQKSCNDIYVWVLRATRQRYFVSQGAFWNGIAAFTINASRTLKVSAEECSVAAAQNRMRPPFHRVAVLEALMRLRRAFVCLSEKVAVSVFKSVHSLMPVPN